MRWFRTTQATRRAGDHSVPPTTDPWSRYEALSAMELSSLDHRARQLVAFGALRTEVNNGGFDQYFFNSGGDLALEALEAATVLGLDDVATLIRQALDVFGGGYTIDRDRRQGALDAVDHELFEPLDAAFYAIEQSSDLDAAMSTLAESAEPR